MIVLGDLLVLRAIKHAIQIFCSVSGLLEVVMKYNRFRDTFGIKWVVSMLRNQELKVLKVIEGANYRMYRIRDIRSI